MLQANDCKDVVTLDANGEACRYVRFVLYKENTDNQMALSLIAKQLGIPPTVFRFAGMCCVCNLSNDIFYRDQR